MLQDNSNVVPSEEIQQLRIKRVKVHLLSGRNIKIGSELCDSVFCIFSYSNQPTGCNDKLSRHKSDIRAYDGDHEDNVIIWDDIFDMGTCYSSDTCLHFRVFEYKVARKDVFIAECKVRIADIILSLQQAKQNTNRSSNSNSSTDGNILNEEVLRWYTLVPKGNNIETTDEANIGSGELKIGITLC